MSEPLPSAPVSGLDRGVVEDADRALLRRAEELNTRGHGKVVVLVVPEIVRIRG